MTDKQHTWQMVLDAGTKSIYYFNVDSLESTWTKPTCGMIIPLFQRCKDDANKLHYYHNLLTEEVSWTKPEVEESMIIDSEELENTDSESGEEIWQEIFDEANKLHYYHNIDTDETSWTRPSGKTIIKQVTSKDGVSIQIVDDGSTDVDVLDSPIRLNHNYVDDEWIELLDDKTDCPYYFNTVTNETTWKKPSETQRQASKRALESVQEEEEEEDDVDDNNSDGSESVQIQTSEAEESFIQLPYQDDALLASSEHISTKVDSESEPQKMQEPQSHTEKSDVNTEKLTALSRTEQVDSESDKNLLVKRKIDDESAVSSFIKQEHSSEELGAAKNGSTTATGLKNIDEESVVIPITEHSSDAMGKIDVESALTSFIKIEHSNEEGVTDKNKLAFASFNENSKVDTGAAKDESTEYSDDKAEADESESVVLPAMEHSSDAMGKIDVESAVSSSIKQEHSNEEEGVADNKKLAFASFNENSKVDAGVAKDESTEYSDDKAEADESESVVLPAMEHSSDAMGKIDVESAVSSSIKQEHSNEEEGVADNKKLAFASFNENSKVDAGAAKDESTEYSDDKAEADESESVVLPATEHSSDVTGNSDVESAVSSSIKQEHSNEEEGVADKKKSESELELAEASNIINQVEAVVNSTIGELQFNRASMSFTATNQGAAFERRDSTPIPLSRQPSETDIWKQEENDSSMETSRWKAGKSVELAYSTPEKHQDNKNEVDTDNASDFSTPEPRLLSSVILRMPNRGTAGSFVSEDGETTFELNQYVELHGLDTQPKYNGKQGIIKGLEDGRYKVLLDDYEYKSLKPANLSVVLPPERVAKSDVLNLTKGFEHESVFAKFRKLSNQIIILQSHVRKFVKRQQFTRVKDNGQPFDVTNPGTLVIQLVELKFHKAFNTKHRRFSIESLLPQQLHKHRAAEVKLSMSLKQISRSKLDTLKNKTHSETISFGNIPPVSLNQKGTSYHFLEDFQEALQLHHEENVRTRKLGKSRKTRSRRFSRRLSLSKKKRDWSTQDKMSIISKIIDKRIVDNNDRKFGCRLFYPGQLERCSPLSKTETNVVLYIQLYNRDQSNQYFVPSTYIDIQVTKLLAYNSIDYKMLLETSLKAVNNDNEVGSLNLIIKYFSNVISERRVLKRSKSFCFCAPPVFKAVDKNFAERSIAISEKILNGRCRSCNDIKLLNVQSSIHLHNLRTYWLSLSSNNQHKRKVSELILVDPNEHDDGMSAGLDNDSQEAVDAEAVHPVASVSNSNQTPSESVSNSKDHVDDNDSRDLHDDSVDVEMIHPVASVSNSNQIPSESVSKSKDHVDDNDSKELHDDSVDVEMIHPVASVSNSNQIPSESVSKSKDHADDNDSKELHDDSVDVEAVHPAASVSNSNQISSESVSKSISNEHEHADDNDSKELHDDSLDVEAIHPVASVSGSNQIPSKSVSKSTSNEHDDDNDSSEPDDDSKMKAVDVEVVHPMASVSKQIAAKLMFGDSYEHKQDEQDDKSNEQCDESEQLDNESVSGTIDMEPIQPVASLSKRIASKLIFGDSEEEEITSASSTQIQIQTCVSSVPQISEGSRTTSTVEEVETRVSSTPPAPGGQGDFISVGAKQESKTEWVKTFDKKRERYFWYNRITKKSTWKDPFAQVSEWKERFSEKHQRKFWFNTATKQSVWKDPFKEKLKKDKWYKGYSSQHKRYFWYNDAGDKTWKNPANSNRRSHIRDEAV